MRRCEKTLKCRGPGLNPRQVVMSPAQVGTVDSGSDGVHTQKGAGPNSYCALVPRALKILPKGSGFASRFKLFT